MELKGLVSRLVETDYRLIEDGVVPAEDLSSVLAIFMFPAGSPAGTNEHQERGPGE